MGVRRGVLGWSKTSSSESWPWLAACWVVPVWINVSRGRKVMRRARLAWELMVSSRYDVVE